MAAIIPMALYRRRDFWRQKFWHNEANMTRLQIETLLTHLAASAGASSTLVSALESLQSLLLMDADLVDLRKAGLAVHYEIARSIGCHDLIQSYEGIIDNVAQRREIGGSWSRPRMRMIAHEHLMIGRGIVARQPDETVSIMRAHLVRAFANPEGLAQ